MRLREDKFVLYKGPKGPSSIPDVYEVTIAKNYRIGTTWGDATLTGVSATTSTTGVLTFTDLTGLSITGYGGTGDLVISGNTIELRSGTVWDLRLSNGTYIPDLTTGYDVFTTANHGAPSGFIKVIDSGGSMYFLENGFNRHLSGYMIPAKSNDTSVDVLGNPIIHVGVFNRHNLADGIIDYTGTTIGIFNKNAYVGNAFGLPEIWTTNGPWLYDDGNPLHWIPEERTMDYLVSAITSTYKNTIMVKEISVATVLVGISREEVFSEPISDSNYNLMNFIYNNIPIP